MISVNGYKYPSPVNTLSDFYSLAIFFLFVLCIKTLILTALRDDFKHIRGRTE